jgi:hypothetical protein
MPLPEEGDRVISLSMRNYVYNNLILTGILEHLKHLMDNGHVTGK